MLLAVFTVRQGELNMVVTIAMDRDWIMTGAGTMTNAAAIMIWTTTIGTIDAV